MRDPNSNVLIPSPTSLYHTFLGTSSLTPYTHTHTHLPVHTHMHKSFLPRPTSSLSLSISAFTQDAPPPTWQPSHRHCLSRATHPSGLSSRPSSAVHPVHTPTFPAWNDSSTWSFQMTHLSPEFHPVSDGAGLFHQPFGRWKPHLPKTAHSRRLLSVAPRPPLPGPAAPAPPAPRKSGSVVQSTFLWRCGIGQAPQWT